MTPDNLSFFWVFVALAAIIAVLEVVQRVRSRFRRTHRTEVAMSHKDYDAGVQRWETLSTLQQLRDQYAQDQLTYGTPLFERPLDLEAPTETR